MSNSTFNIKRFLKSIGYTQNEWGDDYILTHPTRRIGVFYVNKTYGYWNVFFDNKPVNLSWVEASVEGLKEMFLTTQWVRDESEFATMLTEAQEHSKLPRYYIVSEKDQQPKIYQFA